MVRKRFIALVFGILLFVSVSTAFASGYPVAAIGSFSGIDAVVVGKFNPTDFTFTEAEQISQILGGGLSLLGLPGAFLLTPTQLQSFGFNDADSLKDYVYANYKPAGLELFIFLDIRKVTAVVPSMGQSLRADVYLATMEPETPYLYFLSIEMPLAYIMALA